jgi:hypothetical protein
MARPNQTANEFTKTITPINNTRFIEVEFFATKDEEKFVAKVPYNEPDAAIFPDDESYQVALKIFNENEIDFLKAKKNNWSTEIFVGTEQEKFAFNELYNTMKDGNDVLLKETVITVKSKYKKPLKKHEISITKNFDNGNTEQFISGKLLNFYYIADTLKNKQVKNKFTADIMDFDNNERYSFECAIAVVARKFIDRICSMTNEQLKSDVKISLNRYKSKYGDQIKVSPNVSIVDKDSKYGYTDIAGCYEVSVYDDKNKISVATPQGTESNNAEFLKAFNNKVGGGGDRQILEFYKRIVSNFQSEILKPHVTEFFKTMGWDMEIKDEFYKDKFLKDGSNEKRREVIYLTPINGLSETPKDTVEKPSDILEEDLPF